MRIAGFIVFFIMLVPLFSQSTEYKNQLDEGIRLTYNFQFTEAENIFGKLVDQEPGMPQAFLQLAKIHLWYYMGTGDEGEFGIVKKYCELGISKAEKILDDNYDRPGILAAAGELYAQLAAGYAVNQAAIDAFLKTKSAIGYFEDCVDINPDEANAYLWMGVFKYSISFVPGFLKFAISLTGLSGDKSEGLNLIRLATVKSKHKNAEAEFHFARVLTEYCAEYDSAGIILQRLVKNYPGNLLFKYQYVILKFKIRQLDEAEKLLNEIIGSDNKKFNQTIAFSHFLLGDIYYRRNDFETALKYYNDFIRLTNSLDYTGIANFRMAVCCGMLKNNDLFQKNLILAREGNEDLPDDEYAGRLANYILGNGFSEELRDVIIAENNMLVGNYDEAVKGIEKKLKDFKNGELKGYAGYIVSSAYLGMNNQEKCAEYAAESVQQKYGVFNWVKPAAYLNLAETELGKNNYEKASDFLDDAESNPNDDTKALIVNLRNRIGK